MSEKKEAIKARIKQILAFLGGVVSETVRQALVEELDALIVVLRSMLNA